MDHAKDDMDARRLREQQVEADRVLEALRAALASDGDELLAADERAAIEQAMGVLAGTRQGDDAGAIGEAVKGLEKVCEGYVERRMNRSIQAAMAGHKVEEFE
jgi:molecular chaperone HscA